MSSSLIINFHYHHLDGVDVDILHIRLDVVLGKMGNIRTPTKDELEPGMILWLRHNARRLDPDAFERSGLEVRALHHPALVIRKLSSEHDYVWICQVGSPLTLCDHVLMSQFRCRARIGKATFPSFTANA